MSSKRRQFSRHPVQIPLEVHEFSQVDPSQFAVVTTQDVSSGGVRILSQECWTIGTYLRILIRTEIPLEFIGRVVWCRDVMAEDNESEPKDVEPQCTSESQEYELGIEFLARQANKIESLLQIRSYAEMLGDK